MAFEFKKAVKSQAKGRIGLIGPSGSGKTYTALALAKFMGGRTALIDTEHASASKYADKFDFDTLILEDFHPQNYIDAIKAAGAAGYDNLIIDSLTHAWSGTGGALELVDKAAARSKSGNSYVAWRDVTPLHNQLIEAMLSSPCHIIATMRSKMDYVQEKDANGRTVIKKVGMAPIQRDGMEYEFDVVGDMDVDHNFVISKTRCDALDGAVIKKPGKELADTIKGWLTDGTPVTQPAPQSQAQTGWTPEPTHYWDNPAPPDESKAQPAQDADRTLEEPSPAPSGKAPNWKAFWPPVRALKLAPTAKEEQAFIYREASAFFGCTVEKSLTEVPDLDNDMLMQFLQYLQTTAQGAAS